MSARPISFNGSFLFGSHICLEVALNGEANARHCDLERARWFRWFLVWSGQSCRIHSSGGQPFRTITPAHFPQVREEGPPLVYHRVCCKKHSGNPFTQHPGQPVHEGYGPKRREQGWRKGHRRILHPKMQVVAQSLPSAPSQPFSPSPHVGRSSTPLRPPDTPSTPETGRNFDHRDRVST